MYRSTVDLITTSDSHHSHKSINTSENFFNPSQRPGLFLEHSFLQQYNVSHIEVGSVLDPFTSGRQTLEYSVAMNHVSGDSLGSIFSEE